jgi:DNA-binding LacI/PurR family transcriptional regulator
MVGSDWRDWAASEVGIQRLAGVEVVFGETPTFSASNSSIDSGIVAGLELLSDPVGRPTAVIAQSDLLAIGVIRAVEQLGLSVPDDVSVAGFDGARIDSGYDLTTMVQPAVQKGRAAGRAIIGLLAGEDPKPVSFTTVFHPGNTTTRPRKPAGEPSAND